MPKEKASEQLAKKTMEILNNPPGYDFSGRKMDKDMTYREAFEVACRENVDLEKEYILELNGGG